MNTRLVEIVLGFLLAAGALSGAGAGPGLDYRIQIDTVSSGFDGKTCWAQARIGTIPGEHPVVVLTMQKLLLGASDVYFALNEMRTEDLGAHWSPPVEHATLGRRNEPGGSIINLTDFTPKWHARSGKLLGTGSTSHYSNEIKLDDPPARPAYSAYDAEHHTWSPWAALAMPADPRIHHMSGGSSQRVDLPNGDILLPVYFKGPGVTQYHTTILRCRFDGRTLTYVNRGDELTFAFDPATISEKLSFRQRQFDARQAGLFEPSLTELRGRFYLTMRNRHAGYVTSGTDGQHFDRPRAWTFDDGELLGNYNTQQHWVTHSDGLYLVYTRRGAKNDHVFRHRAPLLIAQVDPERLCVLRATERILIPEKGADIGNFAVTNVNATETWVSDVEIMPTQPGAAPPSTYGSNNNVYVARILWNRPNRLADAMAK